MGVSNVRCHYLARHFLAISERPRNKRFLGCSGHLFMEHKEEISNRAEEREKALLISIQIGKGRSKHAAGQCPFQLQGLFSFFSSPFLTFPF